MIQRRGKMITYPLLNTALTFTTDLPLLWYYHCPESGLSIRGPYQTHNHLFTYKLLTFKN